jgi:hypothetical protein
MALPSVRSQPLLPLSCSHGAKGALLLSKMFVLISSPLQPHHSCHRCAVCARDHGGGAGHLHVRRLGLLLGSRR